MKGNTLEPVLSWLGGNWGWAVAVFCLFFEIAPIKLHPISFALSWLGKKLTSGIQQDIASLKQDTDANFAAMEARLAENEKAVDMQRIAGIRSMVLDFSNSCLNGRKHTKEEFDHILAENKTYEELVHKYKIENEVYSESYSYIKRIYRKCLDGHKFLMTPTEMEDEGEEL